MVILICVLLVFWYKTNGFGKFLNSLLTIVGPLDIDLLNLAVFPNGSNASNHQHPRTRYIWQ
jgi:hypothetical protein